MDTIKIDVFEIFRELPTQPGVEGSRYHREGNLIEVSPTSWKPLFSFWNLRYMLKNLGEGGHYEAEKQPSSQQSHRSENIKLEVWGFQISQDSRSQGSRKKKEVQRSKPDIWWFLSLKSLVILSHVKWKTKKLRTAAGKHSGIFGSLLLLWR